MKTPPWLLHQSPYQYYSKGIKKSVLFKVPKKVLTSSKNEEDR